MPPVIAVILKCVTSSPSRPWARQHESVARARVLGGRRVRGERRVGQWRDETARTWTAVAESAAPSSLDGKRCQGAVRVDRGRSTRRESPVGASSVVPATTATPPASVFRRKPLDAEPRGAAVGVGFIAAAASVAWEIVNGVSSVHVARSRGERGDCGHAWARRSRLRPRPARDGGRRRGGGRPRLDRERVQGAVGIQRWRPTTSDSPVPISVTPAVTAPPSFVSVPGRNRLDAERERAVVDIGFICRRRERRKREGERRILRRTGEHGHAAERRRIVHRRHRDGARGGDRRARGIGEREARRARRVDGVSEELANVRARTSACTCALGRGGIERDRERGRAGDAAAGNAERARSSWHLL